MDEKQNVHELLYRIWQDDENAFDELFRMFKGFLLWTAQRNVGRFKGICDIDDLYSIAMLSFNKAVNTYREDKQLAFKNYLYLIMMQEFHNLYRSMHRNRNYANVEALSLDGCVRETEGIYIVDTVADASMKYDPRYQFEANELMDALEKVLEKLREEERLAYHLWMAGYSYREISELTHLNTGQINYLISKIKKKLRRLIDSN